MWWTTPVVTLLGHLDEIEENWLHISTKNQPEIRWLKVLTKKKKKLHWRSSLASFAEATWFDILFSNAMTFIHFKCVLSVKILTWSGWMHCCTNVLHERMQHWQIYYLVSIKFSLLKIWMSAFRSEATMHKFL